MAEDKAFKIELGSRAIKVGNNIFTGTFETTDSKLFEEVTKEYKKPEMIYLDLKNNALNIEKKMVKGLVAFKVSEWNEKLKKHVPVQENIDTYRELAYRLSLIEQNEMREKTKLPYKKSSMLRSIEEGASLQNVTYISANDYPGILPPEQRDY